VPQEGLQRFAHEAMATTFEVVVAGQERAYAQQAADAVFAEIDLVEAALSRYIESSDVSKLNHLAAGVTTTVGSRAFECLEMAARVWKDTGGAFDVTIGPLMACWRNPDKSLRKPSEAELAEARAKVGMNLVKLDPANHTVRLAADGMRIDLGGIGKGFALDKAAEMLGDWGVKNAVVHGGTSTVLALGAPPGDNGWPLGVGGAGKDALSAGRVFLRDRALSGSGVELQGRHIFDPRAGGPAMGKTGTWSVCPSATVADALSTAFMVMTVGEVEAYCKKHADTCALLLIEGEGARRYVAYGDWAGLGLDTKLLNEKN